MWVSVVAEQLNWGPGNALKTRAGRQRVQGPWWGAGLQQPGRFLSESNGNFIDGEIKMIPINGLDEGKMYRKPWFVPNIVCYEIDLKLNPRMIENEHLATMLEIWIQIRSGLRFWQQWVQPSLLWIDPSAFIFFLSDSLGAHFEPPWWFSCLNMYSLVI